MYNDFLMFTQGMLTFLSPCILPLLPVYLIYLSSGIETKQSTLLKNTLGFIAGFTLIFVLLGASASHIGTYFIQNKQNLNRYLGLFVMLLALQYIFPSLLSSTFDKLRSLFKKCKVGASTKDASSLEENTIKRSYADRAREYLQKKPGVFSSFLFGVAFCTAWTACISASLGYALSLAASSANFWTGIRYLLIYSLGLGVPFLLTAVFFYQLQDTFTWLKRHIMWFQRGGGVLMFLVGLLMFTQTLNPLLNKLFSFMN